MILDKIAATKREEIAGLKRAFPPQRLSGLLAQAGPPRSLASALAARPGPNIIAEVKRGSPSRGAIDRHADAAQVARSYQAGGAAAISVLCDETYFMGSYADLAAASRAVDLPVLAKEFIVDELQLKVARAHGADAALLIKALHSNARLAELMGKAEELGLEVLLEVHDEGELDEALKLEPPLIGVNNRNLKTMAVDTATTLRLAPLAQNRAQVVAESGLSSPVELAALMAGGVRAFLIGSRFMDQADREQAVRRMVQGARP